MEIKMNDTKLQSPSEIKTFLEGTQAITLCIGKDKKYEWLAYTLKKTNYYQLKKVEKIIVRDYLLRVTQYSRSQLNELLKQYKETKRLGKGTYAKTKFTKQYTQQDVLSLIAIDKAYENLSGPLTKKILERAYHVFDDQNYQRLAKISSSHIYNLRNGNFYKRQRHHFDKTKRTAVAIGIRRKPQPNGSPGYIRIDTVHQGDLDKKKGVYHINAVDEITQFEAVCSVEKISEQYLIPILEMILSIFPFKIRGFHSDNGSEYINSTVAKLLNKLYIDFTKSRPRRSNDNGLVESKNGSIIRKTLGYIHMPQKHAPMINEFNSKHLTPHLNYHRPCYFSEEVTDKKGKIKKTYPYKNIMTPYEKLKSLPDASQYLKEGVSFDQLDKEAIRLTDLESAKQMLLAREKLFRTIFEVQ